MGFWRKNWTNGVFCPGVEQWSALVVSSGVLSWFLFPPCDVQTSLESCGRECMVQHRWRCISADIARGRRSLLFALFTLVICTVPASWRLHCERVQWQVYLKVIRLIQTFDLRSGALALLYCDVVLLLSARWPELNSCVFVSPSHMHVSDIVDRSR